jgi:hypothetical protein
LNGQAEQKIEGLIRAHIMALGDDQSTAGYVPGGRGSIQFQRSELWREGEKQFLELERCFEAMKYGWPVTFAHLRARYYQTRETTKMVGRRGNQWIGLEPHCQVTSMTGGPRTDVSGGHRSHRKALIVERVTVESWPHWVRLERVSEGLGFVHAQFLRDRIEPCVPASVWKAA